MKSHCSRIGFMALLLLVASCSGKGKGESGDAADTAQSETSTGADDANSTTESMAELLREIEELQARTPRDRFDPSAVVAASRDPAEILSWVREHTHAVPYEGSLRGPAGVLLDRSGNSLDRALLLSKLFELAGHEARIVGDELSLKKSSRVSPAEPTAFALEQSEYAKAQRMLRERANTTATMILDKVGRLTAVEPSAESTHYWVQYKDGNQWVDADPTLAGIGEIHQGARGEPLEGDVKDLAHSVTMRLIVERWEAGKLVESTLAVVPFDSAGGPIPARTVTFAPINRSTGRAVQRSYASGAEFSEKLMDETAWAVILGDETGRGRIGRMFDDAGIVGDVPRFDAAGELNAAGGQAFGAMTGDLGGYDTAEDAAAEAPTVLTALIAEYELRSAGGPTRKLRRFIFDSIGPEARRVSASTLPRPRWTDQQVIERGADLAALNDTLVAFAGLPFETYLYRYAQRVIDAKDAILAIVAGSKDDAMHKRVAHAVGFRTLEYFAAERNSTLDPGLTIVEPQVYRRVIRFMPTANANAIDVGIFADLAWNRLAPATGSTSAESVVAQGVLDTLQEREIVMADGPPQAGQNTAALFAEAAKQGIEIVVLRNASDERLRGFPAAVQARMLGDIDVGQIVVTPVRPVKVASRERLGWWRVDPDSGQTVGAMDTGLLADFAEYSIIDEAKDAELTGATHAERARNWANEVARRRGGAVSDTQYQNLMNRCLKELAEHGVVPSI